MQDSTLTINSAVKPIATGGAIGMCAGFLAAPEKYSLKKLLVQTPDSFTRIFPAYVTKKMNALEKNSLEQIKKSAGDFLSSGKPEQKPVKTAAINWAKKFNAIPIDETLAQNLINKKNYLKKVVENNNFIAIRMQFSQAKDLLMEDIDNKFMKEYYERVKKQFKIAKQNIKKPVEEYRNIVKEVREQRIKNMKNLPNKGIDIKLAYEDLQKAVALKRTKSANKLYELTSNSGLKKNYKNISRFLPKARTRAALQGAMLLSTLTAIGVFIFNPSPRIK